MVKLYFFTFRVTSLRLKNKKFHFELLTWWVLLFSHFRVTNLKLVNEKKSLNITVWMSMDPWESVLLLRFLRTSYNNMCWGFPGMLKSRSCMDVVSNRWESIVSFFRGCIHLLYLETIIFKNFETWLPATYNNGRVVKY